SALVAVASVVIAVVAMAEKDQAPAPAAAGAAAITTTSAKPIPTPTPRPTPTPTPTPIPTPRPTPTAIPTPSPSPSTSTSTSTKPTSTVAPRDEIEDPFAAKEPGEGDLAHEAGIQRNLGNFREAIDLYKRAYRASPAPKHLRDIADCYREAGDCENGLFFYKRYLALAGDDPAAELFKSGLEMQCGTPPPTGAGPGKAKGKKKKSSDLVESPYD
ncbi:MAG TPA: tetratricopeptide repeat protein, partial [Kofleriaceae bacterium]|nr:tetratricopeptide repeat protein [Kofleriaceae bacterium]